MPLTRTGWQCEVRMQRRHYNHDSQQTVASVKDLYSTDQAPPCVSEARIKIMCVRDESMACTSCECPGWLLIVITQTAHACIPAGLKVDNGNRTNIMPPLGTFDAFATLQACKPGEASQVHDVGGVVRCKLFGSPLASAHNFARDVCENAVGCSAGAGAPGRRSRG